MSIVPGRAPLVRRGLACTRVGSRTSRPGWSRHATSSSLALAAGAARPAEVVGAGSSTLDRRVDPAHACTGTTHGRDCGGTNGRRGNTQGRRLTVAGRRPWWVPRGPSPGGAEAGVASIPDDEFGDVSAGRMGDVVRRHQIVVDCIREEVCGVSVVSGDGRLVSGGRPRDDPSRREPGAPTSTKPVRRGLGAPSLFAAGPGRRASSVPPGLEPAVPLVRACSSAYLVLAGGRREPLPGKIFEILERSRKTCGPRNKKCV